MNQVLQHRKFRLIAVTGIAMLLVASLLLVVVRQKRSVTIILTGAIHGGVSVEREGTVVYGGLPLIMGAIEKHSADSQSTIFVDAGNSLFQDSEHQNLSQEIAESFSNFGYSALVPGHRDFEVIRSLGESLDVPILGCNANDTQADLSFESHVSVKTNGIDVLFIGVIDPEIPNLQSLDDLRGFEIGSAQDAKACVFSVVEQYSADHDLTVILSSSLDSGFNESLAAEIDGVDAVLGLGDAVAGTDKSIEGTRILGAAWAGRQIAQLSTTLSRNGETVRMESSLEPISYDTSSDTNAISPSSEYRAVLRDFYFDKLSPPQQDREDIIIGRIDNAEGIQKRVENQVPLEYLHWSFFPAPIEQFIAHSILNEARLGAIDSTVNGSERVEWWHGAIYNSGAIECGLQQGAVKTSDLHRCLPYDNLVIGVRLTGSQLRSILSSHGTIERGFLPTAGIKYARREDSNLASEISVEFSDGYREISDIETVNIITTDFLLSGGDDYFDTFIYSLAGSDYRPDLYESENERSTIELVSGYIYRTSPVFFEPPRNLDYRR